MILGACPQSAENNPLRCLMRVAPASASLLVRYDKGPSKVPLCLQKVFHLSRSANANLHAANPPAALPPIPRWRKNISNISLLERGDTSAMRTVNLRLECTRFCHGGLLLRQTDPIRRIRPVSYQTHTVAPA